MKEDKEYAFVQLRIKPIEKNILQHRAEKEGVTLTEYILQRSLPDKYSHEKQLEDNWQKEINS